MTHVYGKLIHNGPFSTLFLGIGNNSSAASSNKSSCQYGSSTHWGGSSSRQRFKKSNTYEFKNLFDDQF